MPPPAPSTPSAELSKKFHRYLYSHKHATELQKSLDATLSKLYHSKPFYDRALPILPTGVRWYRSRKPHEDEIFVKEQACANQQLLMDGILIEFIQYVH